MYVSKEALRSISLLHPRFFFPIIENENVLGEYQKNNFYYLINENKFHFFAAVRPRILFLLYCILISFSKNYFFFCDKLFFLFDKLFYCGLVINHAIEHFTIIPFNSLFTTEILKFHSN